MKRFSFVLLLTLGSAIYAQEANTIYFNNEFFPNSEVGDVSKTTIGVDIPVINSYDKESFSVGASYQSTNLSYVDKDVPFETDQIEGFHTFALKLQYNRLLKNNWGITLMAQSQISSNFDEMDFSEKDLFFNGALIFDKLNEEKRSMWSFGVINDAQYGLYFPIPTVSYTKRINDFWAYKLGVPDSRVKWTWNKNSNFEAFAALDGFSGNINDDIEIYKEDYVGTLRQTSVVSGLAYNFNFWRNFQLNAKSGYTLYNHMEVQNYDNEEIYDFDLANGWYFNVGMSYKLGKKVKLKSPY
ncbi:DUF6268 family outer membrane beta-barrel protein [Arenibacter sp. F26102]|uniref:DUF6268 family outer membrane beta-barrel protein n=1 Tax=Arenibacter sp. F26102 TaxID=2926416 RepID=UPI001FF21B48|nr:DUF6268 family outer membrane beta-barrel protein [Arenibacter sp. F26102]MCK0146709.1 DUF6268 family outer membrane beta-barrel protein [Arenibacter sp. F26102]